MSTLIAKEEMERRVRAEGVTELPLAIGPRWAESKPSRQQGPYSPPVGVKSALIHCDLLVRSDGSLVLLDGAMAKDSIALAQKLLDEGLPPGDWDEFVEANQVLPDECKT